MSGPAKNPGRSHPLVLLPAGTLRPVAKGISTERTAALWPISLAPEMSQCCNSVIIWQRTLRFLLRIQPDPSMDLWPRLWAIE
jgi:hypothetical protein